MKRLELISRVRSNTRDFSNSIFRETDIIDYLNEGINRFKQVIPELLGVVPLLAQNQEVILIPSQYQVLLSTYASARCFAQDERHYQATTLMNEFEVKLQELLSEIECGNIVILDTLGVPIVIPLKYNYVDTEAYFGKIYTDLDDGVEGV